MSQSTFNVTFTLAPRHHQPASGRLFLFHQASAGDFWVYLYRVGQICGGGKLRDEIGKDMWKGQACGPTQPCADTAEAGGWRLPAKLGQSWRKHPLLSPGFWLHRLLGCNV
ncbi:hypothetical protein E5D57_011688 [Metarhizium anisopliae]|nr:hypothetical protein E5D57_011688 [Metarhizium anisopliae]